MIEFIEETHTYLVNGMIVPSVSQILRSTLFSKQYEGVPKFRLEQAAQFGTNVHKAIETDVTDDLSLVEKLCYDEWIKIKNKNNISVIAQEQVVHYEDKYCGTFDGLFEIDGKIYLNDFKTTYKLDKEYLSWQLSFYKLAYENMYDKKIDGLVAVWLPKKRIGEFVEIEIKSKEEVLELVDRYHFGNVV